jgi:hypothetical protein
VLLFLARSGGVVFEGGVLGCRFRGGLGEFVSKAMDAARCRIAMPLLSAFEVCVRHPVFGPSGFRCKPLPGYGHQRSKHLLVDEVPDLGQDAFTQLHAKQSRPKRGAQARFKALENVIRKVRLAPE